MAKDLSRNKLLVDDTRWKTKGGAHKVEEDIPDVCPNCNGTGVIGEFVFNDLDDDPNMCEGCQGTGEIH